MHIITNVANRGTNDASTAPIPAPMPKCGPVKWIMELARGTWMMKSKFYMEWICI